MLTAYLFDRERGTHVERWAESLRKLSEDEVLWVDVTEPSEQEAQEVREAFGLHTRLDLSASSQKARLTQENGFLVVSAVAISDEETDIEKERVVLECFVGPNWLLAHHDAPDLLVEAEVEVAHAGSSAF